MGNPISLSFTHGDDVNYPITVKDSGGTPIDLTGASVKADIRKEYTTSVITSFVPNYTDLANGAFELDLSQASSALLPQNTKGRINSFVFDVELTYLSGDKDTIISGYLKVINEVTV